MIEVYSSSVIHVLLFYVTGDQHDQLVITHKCTEL